MLGPDRPRFVSDPTASSPSIPSGAAASEGPLGSKQLAAVRKFIAQVGGIENARNALELLAILSGAETAQRKSAH